MPSICALASALGGQVVGPDQVLVPGPGRSPHNRSLSVWFGPQHREGFRVHPHSDAYTYQEGRDHVRRVLFLDPEGWRQKEHVVGGTPAPIHDEASRIRRAVRIFDVSVPITGTLAETYLRSRCLEVDGDELFHAVRFHPRCPWGMGADAQLVPAIVSLCRSVTTNAPRAIHRIRLDEQGRKVDRMALGPIGGSAVKIDADEDVTMGLAIGEGLETTIAGRMMGFRPAWCLLNVGGIGRLPVLGGIEALTIFGEPGEASSAAIEACGTRWHGAGREVAVIDPVVGDLNDALQHGAAA